MKNFGLDQSFQNFDLKDDSIAMNFSNIDDLLNNFMESPQDSILVKMPGQQFKSLEDRLKLLQKHLQKMEELQIKSLKNQTKMKNF